MTRYDLEQSLGAGAFNDLVAGLNHLVDEDVGQVEKYVASGLPPAQALILGLFDAAIFRLQRWVNAGLIRNLDPLMPKIKSAYRVSNKIMAGDLDGAVWEGAWRFAKDMLTFWVANFSWSARRLLGVDIIIRSGHAAGDRRLHAVAEFAWANRRRC